MRPHNTPAPHSDGESERRSHVLSGLIAKRREIAGRIVQAEVTLAQMRADLLHLDATIELMKPGFDLSVLTPKRIVNRSQLFRRGELGRYIRDILRLSTQPMAARDMALLIAARAAIPVDDQRVITLISHEAARALCLMRRRGHVNSVKGTGREVLWYLP